MQTYRELYDVMLHRSGPIHEIAQVWAWSSEHARTIARINHGGTIVDVTLHLQRW